MIILPITMAKALEPKLPGPLHGVQQFVQQRGGKWPSLIYPTPKRRRRSARADFCTLYEIRNFISQRGGKWSCAKYPSQ